eukprot:scaffold86709_cov65-Phaeocystis_antarctica.AAC.4
MIWPVGAPGARGRAKTEEEDELGYGRYTGHATVRRPARLHAMAHRCLPTHRGDLLAAGAGVGAGASPSAATGASAGAAAGSMGAGAGVGWLRLAQAGAQAPAAAPAAASSPQMPQGSQTQSAGQIYFEG